ncbi:conserved hypothetical protein [Ricinus communis]|uniref:Uncharacterized protein n=1 Tax=Ricinus communis TaxID=3988 RepID=B9SEK7_RICCO|nr:conserved hypothetical protein [Ricinus communis]
MESKWLVENGVRWRVDIGLGTWRADFIMPNFPEAEAKAILNIRSSIRTEDTRY